MLELYKLYKLSRQYCEVEDYVQAKSALQEMIRLKTELLGRNYAGCSFDLYNLGLINGALQNYGTARRYLIRALQIQKRQKGKNQLINIPETLQILAGFRKERQIDFVIAQAA